MSDLGTFLEFDALTRDYPEQAVLDSLFDKQLEFFRDEAKKKALLCGRRAGKTDLLCKMLLDCAGRFPGRNQWTGYVTPTQLQSLRNLEETLEDLIERYDIPCKKHLKNNQAIWRHANGHQIWIGGVNDMPKAERLRGNKWRLFVIDEAGAIHPEVLKYLVVDVVNAAMKDYRGTLVVSGTPGPIGKGFWFDITTGRGDKFGKWPTYHWTCTENPHMEDAYNDPEGFLKAERDEWGWDEDNATYRKEWLGEWALDRDLMIYRYSMEANGYINLPELAVDEQWDRTLAIDVGQVDKTAFTVACSRKGWSEIYLEESFGAPGMLNFDVATKIHEIYERYGGNIRKITVDNSGGGLGLIKELRRTYGITAYPTEKKGSKLGGIRMMQDYLAKGWLKVNPYDCGELLGEWATITWNEDHTDHDKGIVDDCADSAIYCVREHKAFLSREHERPAPGTEAWERMQVANYERALSAEIRIQNSKLNPLEKRRQLRALREMYR